MNFLNSIVKMVLNSVKYMILRHIYKLSLLCLNLLCKPPISHLKAIVYPNSVHSVWEPQLLLMWPEKKVFSQLTSYQWFLELSKFQHESIQNSIQSKLVANNTCIVLPTSYSSKAYTLSAGQSVFTWILFMCHDENEDEEENQNFCSSRNKPVETNLYFNVMHIRGAIG